MRKFSAAFIVLFVLLVVPLLGCNKVRARTRFKDANSLYKDGNYAGALAEFQEGLSLDPSATFAWRSVGLSAMALLKPEDTSPANLKFADIAVDAFKKYLQDYPKDSKVEDWLVTTWVNAGKFDDAINFLKAQRREHPENPRYTQAVISVMIKASRFQDALDFANSFAGKDPQIYYTIATQAWSKSYNDPTVKYEDRVQIVDVGLGAAQRAVEIKPDYSDAMVYYGLLYREKAKLDLDPARQKQWTALAAQWRDKALALRNASRGETTPAEPTAAPKGTS
jgi:tetratricopeptide (TPR) repeat protein